MSIPFLFKFIGVTIVNMISFSFGNETITYLPGHASFYSNCFSNGVEGDEVKGEKSEKPCMIKLRCYIELKAQIRECLNDTRKYPEYLNMPHILTS